MRKMKKIMILLILPFMSACTLFNYSLSTIQEFYSNEQSYKFSHFRTPTNIDETINNGNELIDFIKQDTNETNKFILGVNKFFKSFTLVIDAIYITRTNYYATSNQEYRSEYFNLYDAYQTLNEIRYNILLESSKTNYKDIVFSDMTDEEINDILSRLYTNEDIANISSAMEEISSNAEEVYNQHYQSQEYESLMYDLLVEYKDLVSQYNELKNIDDYLSYSYENTYSRDYTPEHILPFYEAVKTNLVPVVNNYDIGDINVLSQEDRTYLNNFEKVNFRNYSLNVIPSIESYIDLVKPLRSAYNRLWSSGYYCFSDSDSSLGTAYTASLAYASEPILYFSKYYQNVFTFIHEFGHYTDAYYNGSDETAMDISEIHSQGNELLFASYLEDHKSLPISDEALDCLIRSQLKQMMRAIFYGTYVSEVEQYVFYNDISNKEETINQIHEINSNYGGIMDAKYCWAPILGSPAYYISYATSSIGALELYINSREDYGKAVNQYIGLIDRDEDENSISSLMNKTGLKPINSSSAVNYIAEYFDNN